jgi:glycosyltransferase involved in cell wall biosynthesis
MTCDVTRPRVSVVIPAMNEAKNLPYVLSQLPLAVDEVVLVDGHSTDDTVDVARALRPDLLVIAQQGKGKGNALAVGFALASGDIIVMLDADGSADPQEIPRFLDAIYRGADVAKGTRFALGGGSKDITRLRRAGNGVLTAMVNLLFGTRYSDLCYGYNALRADCLPSLGVDCNGFEVETLINIRIAKSGLRVVEVPSFEYPRRFGVSNLNAVRDGWRVLKTIISERVRGGNDSRPPVPALRWSHLPAGPEMVELAGRAATDREGALLLKPAIDVSSA